MDLFNIFKKAHESYPKPSVKKQLRLILDHMPDIYKKQHQYVHAVDFFENQEWALTIESLIEMTMETNHYFSEEFWKILTYTAETMNMKNLAIYCIAQIDRNRQELKSKIPFGWTMEKNDDDYFVSHIPEVIKQQWVKNRHIKDNVNLLLKKKDGIYLKMTGRVGTLYVISHGRLAEVSTELGMLGLILYFKNTNYWMLPIKKAFTELEKLNTKEAIRIWASSTDTMIQFDDY